MPDSIALGPLLLPTQALLLLIATAAALGVLSLLRDAEPPLRARAEARLFIALVLGLLGARIGWILRHWQAYADSPGAKPLAQPSRTLCHRPCARKQLSAPRRPHASTPGNASC